MESWFSYFILKTAMKKFKLFIALILFVLLSSCHSLVEDEFDNFAQLPVMNALLQADGTFNVQISLTANLTDTGLVYVSNAQVIIESKTETPDTLEYTEKGWYASSRRVKVGETYSCTANIPGYAALSATTTIPLPTVIDSVIYTDLAERGEEGEKISSVQFRIQNDVHSVKFWELKLKIRSAGTHYDLDAGDWSDSSYEHDAYIYIKPEQNPVFLFEPNPLEIFSNKKITKDIHWLKFYINSRYNGFSSSRRDTAFIELQNIDVSLYTYQKQFYIYQSSGQPTLGSSMQNYNLYTNVRNGLGLFTGTSTTRKDIPVIKKTNQ